MKKAIRKRKEWFDKLTEMAVVKLKAGDFVVVHTAEKLTAEQFKGMELQMRAFLDRIGFPEIQVLVLGPAASMEVVRPEQAQALKGE